MGTHESKGEPVPYTAPDYDPDNSGRPAADVPQDASATPPSSDAGGEQAELAKEPQPYVDPVYDPDKG